MLKLACVPFGFWPLGNFGHVPRRVFRDGPDVSAGRAPVVVNMQASLLMSSSKRIVSVLHSGQDRMGIGEPPAGV